MHNTAGFTAGSMPTIGMDDTLYLEGVPDELQPGLFVRRVNGKTLNDEEMIEYYTSLVKKYGVDNKLNCKWVYGLAVIDKSGCESTYTWYKDDFYMTDISSDIINPGYPLNTISKYKKIDKYFTDKLSEEEKEIINFNEDSTIDFIKDHKKPHYRDLKRKYVRLKQELFLYDKLRSENNG